MQKILQEAYQYASCSLGKGRPASYIPELAGADPFHLAIAVTDLAGNVHAVGSSKVRFTMQSISKVVLLALGYTQSEINRIGK